MLSELDSSGLETLKADCLTIMEVWRRGVVQL